MCLWSCWRDAFVVRGSANEGATTIGRLWAARVFHERPPERTARFARFSLPAGERKAATATVFLVDASLSTSQVSSGTTVFDRIKAETIRGLDQL